MTPKTILRAATLLLLITTLGCPTPRGGGGGGDDDDATADDDDAGDDDDQTGDDDDAASGCNGAAATFSESEPNDSEGQANAVTHNNGDVTITGSVGTCADGTGGDDYLRVDFGCTDSATFRLTWTGGDTDLDLYVWNDDATLIEGFDASYDPPEEGTATVSGPTVVQVACWESSGANWTLEIDFVGGGGDDDDSTGDDDDATGDDDDATGPPCNPTAAELACQNAGPSLGSGAYSAQAISATPVDCGNDVWTPGIDLRSLPSTVVGAYIGWWAPGAGNQLLSYVVGSGTDWVEPNGPTNAFGGAPTNLPIDGSVVGAVFPQSQSTFPQDGCLGVVPVTYAASGAAGELLYTVRTDDQPSGYFEVSVGNVVNSGLSQSQLDDAMQVAADLLYFDPDTQLDLSWSHYAINDSTYTTIPTDGPVVNALRATVLGTDDRTVNLYVVGAFDSVGTLGFAGGIPGPLGFQGLPSSGVILAADPALDGGFDSTQFGQTIAHELGHQLGLFHTSEADGTAWDPMGDTPQCLASADTNGTGQVEPDECPDGGNVMFWQAAPGGTQTDVTPEQSDVLYFSPILY